MITFTKATTKVIYRNTEPFFRLHDGYTMRSQVFGGGEEVTYNDLLLVESEAESDCCCTFLPDDREAAYNWLEKVQAEIKEFERKFKESLRSRGIELKNSIES